MTRHIGEAHLGAGRHAQAVSALQHARSMFAAQADAYMEARTLTTLALAHLRSGDPAAALDPLAQSLAITTSLGARHEEARTRVALADAAEMLGDTERARDELQAALTIYEQADAPEADELRLRLGKAGSADA